MAIEGRTDFLILGLLAEGPCSGYDIRRITDIRFKFFWSESYGQIYPALKRLEMEGSVNSEQGGVRRRRVYSIAPPGREKLRAWLADPATAETARYEAILKFSFSWAMDAEDRNRLLSDFNSRQLEKLRELKGFRRELKSIPDPHGNHDIALMTIDLGIATYEAWTAWSDRATESLSSRGDHR